MSWIFLDASSIHLSRENANHPMSESSRIRNGFYPFKDPEILPNCKRYVFITPDLTSVEAAYLNVNDKRDRETIILFHFLSEAIRLFGNESLGLNIKGRDNPWDFTIEFSNSEVKHFEIVSVCDDREFFRKLSREEFHQNITLSEKVTISMLKKIQRDFPDVGIQQDVTDLIHRHDDRVQVPNPFFQQQSIFISRHTPSPTDRPEEHILAAIDSKAAKKHFGKEETVLLIDNRFMRVDLVDLVSSMSSLRDEIFNAPFEEIWLYTGYGGYYFGVDGEYALLPLKLRDEQSERYLVSKPNEPPWFDWQ